MNAPTPHAIPNVRTQRLLREIVGNDDGPTLSAGNVRRIVAAVGFSIMAAAAFSGSLPERHEKVSAVAADQVVAPDGYGSPAAPSRLESEGAVTEGNVQDMTY